jgi:hypothetical protein
MNLRLGVWVPHPAVRAPRRRLFPGLLFYKELFGLTDAAPRSKEDAATDVHLSDGGHFENLALYELVRRHCRYVVVVDAGQDLDVAFDDFGNAARRVREDFGVDIEIDLSPLAPGENGCARQHVAVGRIHYDRRYDKGILVYLKPTLTGDEPPDVRQYRRRNSVFPHEPTTDQFYDEAQWESYRQLGLHTVVSAFGFVKGLAKRPSQREVTADQIFTGIRHEWWPTPAGLADRVLAATQRLTSLESAIIDRGAERLLAEAFPELVTAAPAGSATLTLAEQVRITATLVEVAQVLEDIWLTCDLDDHWDHPLNLGWINGFARWTHAATFRAWWPVLRPMFSPGFQRFMRERFPTLGKDKVVEGALKPFSNRTLPEGLAAQWWLAARPPKAAERNVSGFEYIQTLEVHDVEKVVQMGFVALTGGGSRVTWTSEDFFVPPSLWGAGIGGAFLRAVLGDLVAAGIRTCDVYVVNRDDEQSRSQRTERVGFIEFYRGQGFQVVAKGVGGEESDELRALLTPPAEAKPLDAWVQLRWTAPTP